MARRVSCHAAWWWKVKSMRLSPVTCGTPKIPRDWELDRRADLVGGLVAINLAFSQKYWECHHPNWLSYFSEGFKPPVILLLILSAQDMGLMRWRGSRLNGTSTFWSLALCSVTLPVNPWRDSTTLHFLASLRSLWFRKRSNALDAQMFPTLAAEGSRCGKALLGLRTCAARHCSRARCTQKLSELLFIFWEKSSNPQLMAGIGRIYVVWRIAITSTSTWAFFHRSKTLWVPWVFRFAYQRDVDTIMSLNKKNRWQGFSWTKDVTKKHVVTTNHMLFPGLLDIIQAPFFFFFWLYILDNLYEKGNNHGFWQMLGDKNPSWIRWWENVRNVPVKSTMK